eukprot:2957649-Amphidinium_carterae.2
MQRYSGLTCVPHTDAHVFNYCEAGNLSSCSWYAACAMKESERPNAVPFMRSDVRNFLVSSPYRKLDKSYI